MIYFEKPLLLVLLAVILALHIAAKFLRFPLWITIINAAVHIAAISLSLIYGGSMEDVLVLVLMSSLIAILMSPVPIPEDTDGGKDK